MAWNEQKSRERVANHSESTFEVNVVRVIKIIDSVPIRIIDGISST